MTKTICKTLNEKSESIIKLQQQVIALLEDYYAQPDYSRWYKLFSIQDSIDTSTATGKFLFTILCAMAQMERDIIRERTKARLASARVRGKSGGRPTK